MTTCSFATFCHKGDGHRLHKLGHLKMMVESNGYNFDEVLVIHQLCNPFDFDNPLFDDYDHPSLGTYVIKDLDEVLRTFGIDLSKPQYISEVDKVHTWKNHVVNHLEAIRHCHTDYIVFVDSDCWMIKQPSSWVDLGIRLLENDPSIFIISPNDGEPERKTQVMSQQMFLVRTEDFRQVDFNQPGYSGNPRDYPEMPEYAAMMEGRMSFYCRSVGKYRYVLPSEFRYFHHNRTNEDGSYKTNYSDYGL